MSPVVVIILILYSIGLLWLISACSVSARKADELEEWVEVLEEANRGLREANNFLKDENRSLYKQCETLRQGDDE